MIRAVILYKQVFRELMRAMHPRGLQTVRFGPDGDSRPGAAFDPRLPVHLRRHDRFLTLLLIATHLDVITAFSAVVACINNTGPGLNLVGPTTTYAVLTDFQTWVCTWAMLLGRLEIFTLLVILMPAFWRR
jgi:trk system potassium uptake protein TrkH